MVAPRILLALFAGGSPAFASCANAALTCGRFICILTVEGRDARSNWPPV